MLKEKLREIEELQEQVALGESTSIELEKANEYIARIEASQSAEIERRISAKEESMVHLETKFFAERARWQERQ